MGIVNKSGNRPFSHRQSIDDSFSQARVQFAHVAAEVGLAIFRNYVPIQTGELKSTIVSYVRGDRCIIEVPSRVIHGEDAKALAITLNIGLSKAGKILNRRRSNRGRGTSRGEPTAGWIDNAIQDINIALEPIAFRLMQEATSKAIEGMING